MSPFGRLVLLGLIALCVPVALRAQNLTTSSSSATVPFDWEQRWRWYLYRTYSPERLATLAFDTGFEHLVSPEHSRDIRQFPEQYGGAIARRMARTTVEFGVGGLLGEDIRRRPSNKTGFVKRATWAISHSYMATGSNGNWRPAYSRMAGTLAGFAVGSRIRERPITVGRAGGAITGSILFSFQDSLMTEFQPDMQRIGSGMARRCFRSLGLRR